MSDPLIFFTSVLFFGTLAQWLAWRLRLPSILLLLAAGFVMRYFGQVSPDAILGTQLLLPVISLAVAVVLFEGGMTLHLTDLRPSSSVVVRLVTVGVLVSWFSTWWAGVRVLGMDHRVAALTGAILVVTGPTVIAPLLRHVRPKRRVASILRWEGIVIDPIGAVLAVLVFDAMFNVGPDERWDAVILSIGKTLLVGVGLATVAGLLLIQMLKRFWIADFLHNPVLLAVALAVFTLSNRLQTESGLVSVTLLGIILANQKTFSIRHVVEFKENLSILLVTCLFMVLAARIDLVQVVQLGWRGIVFLLLMIVVVRPLSVLASTVWTDVDWKERAYLAFLAPRGIVAASVSSVFALEVAHALEQSASPEQLPDSASMLVNVTFLVIVGTVSFYGLLAAPLAKWLNLATPNPQGILFAGAATWVRKIAKAVHDEGFAVLLVDTNYHSTAQARMEGLPVRCADVLSDYVQKEIDLGGIGRLMAMTPNDDLNQLAVMEFAAGFGRAEVYYLAPTSHQKVNRQESTAQTKGRVLFSSDATYYDLSLRMAQGAEIKRTKITEEFSFDAFRQTHGHDALVLFTISDGRQLNVATAGAPLEPKAGQVVIAIVGPSADRVPEAAQQVQPAQSISAHPIEDRRH